MYLLSLQLSSLIRQLAVSVRNISTGEIDEESKFKVALREAGSGFLSGLVCAILLCIIMIIQSNIAQTKPLKKPLPASRKATLNLLSSSISPVEILRTDTANCRIKLDNCNDSRYISWFNDSFSNE